MYGTLNLFNLALETSGFLHFAGVNHYSYVTGENKYYRGGFITRYHGSRYDNADEVDAVQLEFPRELRLGGADVIQSLGKATGKIITKFYNSWYR